MGLFFDFLYINVGRTVVEVRPWVVGFDDEVGGVEDGEPVHDVGAQLRLLNNHK